MMNHSIQLGLLLMLVPVCFFFMIPIITEYFPPKYDKLPAPYECSQQGGAPTPVEQKDSNANHYTLMRAGKVKKSKFRLPRSIINRIKTFAFFLGYPHSGHSIVGSLMDSHPHMIIAHELDLFTKLSKRILSPTKQDIFNAIWRNTIETIINGHRAKHVKGYDLLVDGLYQGNYLDHVDVIGDKKGGATADLLLMQPRMWLGAYNILKSLNLTLKVIQVFRNPYDIIATTVLLEENLKGTFASIKESNATRKYSLDEIDIQIKHYFLHHDAVFNAKMAYNLDLIEIHGKDLIADPRGTLLKLCNHVGVSCSTDYLETCSNKVFKSESRTRRLIKWTDKQLKMVQWNIDKYSDLKGYSFDSL